MASVSKDGSGNVRILFVDANKKRKALYLGGISKKQAEVVKTKIELLIASASSRLPMDAETAAWVGSIGDDLASKLAKAGLIPAREARQSQGLESYFLSYVDNRPDVKPNTRRNLIRAICYMVDYFGADRSVDTVTAGDAVRFAARMRADYASATANRTITHAKQFFRVAERDEIIERNPFRDVRGGSMSNTDRMHFVSLEDTKRLLDACPDGEWRLIVALARFGGLRTPSEHLALTWADLDWSRNRFLVRSPKTGQRWVPIFPELRPHLDEAFDRAEPGATYLITRTRDATANWRTTFNKIVLRAGLLPWEKPFQNLRASRETELARNNPIYHVVSWLGNSIPTAAKHYLQVTDSDFERAAMGNAESDALATQPEAEPVRMKSRLVLESQVNLSSEPGVVDDAKSDAPKVRTATHRVRKHHPQKTDFGGLNRNDAQTTQNPTQTTANTTRPDRTGIGETLENLASCTVLSDAVLYCTDGYHPEKESNLHDRAS